MLAQLLSSKPKSRLVNIFLTHSGRSFSATELRYSTGIAQKNLKRTLNELDKMGFLTTHHKDHNKYFQVNKRFALYPELVGLLRKIKKLPPDLLAKAALKIGECKFLALTGVFAGRPRTGTDILLVGRINPTKLKKFVALAEKFAEREIAYTVFTPNEFDYRIVMNDRFTKDILDNEPVVLVDKTKARMMFKVVTKT
jgi:hypothetical protein